MIERQKKLKSRNPIQVVNSSVHLFFSWTFKAYYVYDYSNSLAFPKYTLGCYFAHINE